MDSTFFKASTASRQDLSLRGGPRKSSNFLWWYQWWIYLSRCLWANVCWSKFQSLQSFNHPSNNSLVVCSLEATCAQALEKWSNFPGTDITCCLKMNLFLHFTLVSRQMYQFWDLNSEKIQATFPYHYHAKSFQSWGWNIEMLNVWPVKKT